MRVKRSAGERARTQIGAWMPLDARKAGLLGVVAVIIIIFASFLH